MNIKALVYARYSTSVKIHTILKEDSNKSLSTDLDKVRDFLLSSLRKPEHSEQEPMNVISSRLLTVYGTSLTMIMIYAMLFVPKRITPKDMLSA